MKLSELTDLYVEAKNKLEAAKPAKRQKAVEGISLGDELIRDGAIISFMMGAIFLLISIVPPPLHPAYDMAQPPRYVKPDRSEERRVGKECRSRWSAYHEKKKKSQARI